MAEQIYMTPEERAKLDSFVREQREAWEQKELQEYHNQRLQGKEYEPQPFPGFDEATALQQIRAGWQSPLDRAFSRKFKQEEGKV